MGNRVIGRVACAVALVLAVAPPAGAADRAGERRGGAAAVRAELETLLGDLTSATRAADAASERWMWLQLREMEARAAEAAARRAFEDRVRAAYVSGRGRAASILLGAATFDDLAARLPYATGVLARQRIDVGDLAARRRALEEVLADAEAAQRTLADTEARLGAVRAAIERRLAESEAAARADALALGEIRRQRARYAGTLDRVAGATRTIRHRRGEAMLAAAAPYLGPRADCSVPDGLRSSGDVLSGEASWYGNAFRGRPTASGATFDPERFTVAHKTLPFGVFLLIRFRDRCVVAFLNDRGPYVDGRILDLSYGSARAVGLTGAKDVTATILVRA